MKLLRRLHIEGYRSLVDLDLRLAPVTVVTGPNGVGKSNLYHALMLVAALAHGRFAEAIAGEGGMPSVLWAGPVHGKRKRREVRVTIVHDEFEYEIGYGLVPTGPSNPTAFRLDPEIKDEKVHLRQESRHLFGSRRAAGGEARDIDGHMHPLPAPLPGAESILTCLYEPERFPGLALVKETLRRWRFYHQFRTDADSPLRKPQPGFWSPILHDEGSNLTCCLQTIIEAGHGDLLAEAIGAAFPGCRLAIDSGASFFKIAWHTPDLSRPLSSRELSDGTLRFVALAAALLSPQPPSLLVLNEPEASLNPRLFPALARLIARAAERSQVLLVTHAAELANELEALTKVRHHELAMVEGATRKKSDGTARRVWSFEEE